MKKIIIFIFLFFIILPVKAISASSYIVMDINNQDVLQEKNSSNPRLIASITKIMTCIIAIEKGNLTEKIKADKSILKAVGSSIYIEVGESLTLEELLYGMMLRSGNDAAIMIANYISGNEDSFVKLMNEYASKIGMNNTIFYNSHGLENADGKGNMSTAYDMALLTSYAMKNKTFQKIFKTKAYTACSEKKKYTWTNKNKLLKYNYINGGKTGYTKKAKRTLVSTAKINNMNLVIVTLNDPNDWQDHSDLYENIKDNFIKIKLLDKNNFNIVDNFNIEDKIYIKYSYAKIIPKNDQKKYKINYKLYNLESYDNNQKVGYVSIYKSNKLIYQEPMYIKKQKKNFFSKIKQVLLQHYVTYI